MSMSDLKNKFKENTILRINTFKICASLFILTFLVYLTSFFLAPFNDWDVSFYPVIGRGIFEHHILPYDYAFDHKPYLVYVFYYVWCQIEPVLNGRFTLLAMFSAGVASYFLGKTYGVDKWKIMFCLCIFSAFSDFFDGNTESIQISLISIFVYLIISSCKSNERIFLFCAGMVCSVASNVNYLSGFILALLSGTFFVCTPLRIYRVLWFLFGSVLSLFLIFLPFFVSKHGDVREYFAMQHHFIHNYSSSLNERLTGIFYLALVLLLLAPIIVSWFREKYYTVDIRYKILSFWFVFSALATALSGHTFRHYFSLLYVPVILMLVIVHHDGKLKYRYALLPFVLWVEFSMIQVVVSNVNSMKHTERENPEFVASIVGKHTVLNIDSDHALYYLANLEPFEKYAFQGQMEIYYKENYNEIYMNDLMKEPKFVILPYRGCADKAVDKSICDFMLANYKLDYVSYSRNHLKKSNRRYYELYELVR